MQKRVNVIKPNIDPAYQNEVNAIASTWVISDQDQLGDGLLSLNEFWVIQLIPDIGGRFNSSGFGVWGNFSALNSPIVGRNMDWQTNEGLRSLQTITVYEYDNRNIVNIGFAGFIGVVSGFNSEGLFVAHLNSSLKKYYPKPPINNNAIVFDLRKILKSQTRISTAARELSKLQYSFSHNILMADPFDVQVLDQPQGQQAHLRVDISPLKIGISWGKVNQIAVVNCFVLRSSPANCIRTIDSFRWHRFKTLTQFNRENQAQVKDVSKIMFDTANPHQKIFNQKTIQSMVFTPKDKKLYLYTVPISGIHSTHPVMHEIINLLPTTQLSKSWFHPINWLLAIAGILLLTVVIIGERRKRKHSIKKK
ncbi:C45 family autoproteolytic acyltransferase/hydolase [Candidatus Parabeggiatoa sp. HSG14]|uniref:C45 family autoproteolytic acyltransferase/hydolase n=1 Tax=Candidatus Parabeggiatoa sp. HSG14 TaxID=3055593 RepID=UPI0025A70266|nr:C45 family autoproteolytic acyltransferase/hydrolase [Thiotrichales bacterium HSG14]